jgi:hypothetical protein
VDLFCGHSARILAAVEERNSWYAVVAAEPGLRISLTEDELDRALEAIGDFTDLKSPYTSSETPGP